MWSCLIFIYNSGTDGRRGIHGGSGCIVGGRDMIHGDIDATDGGRGMVRVCITVAV